MVPVNAVWMNHGPLSRGTEQPSLECIVAEGLETQAARARAISSLQGNCRSQARHSETL